MTKAQKAYHKLGNAIRASRGGITFTVQRFGEHKTKRWANRCQKHLAASKHSTYQKKP